MGRNFPGTFFGCSTSERCNLPRIIQPILLGTVVVLYRFIPFFISKYYQFKLAKEHQTTEAKLQLVPEWILAAESLTLLVEFDALYTVIINSFIPTRTCCILLFSIDKCTSYSSMGAMGLVRSYVHAHSLLHNEHSVLWKLQR